MANGHQGIHLLLSSLNNSIAGNIIADNSQAGIQLYPECNYTSIVGNNITNNNYGISLYESFNNNVHHNNFTGNYPRQVYDVSWDSAASPSISVWDDGYPSGGNYWSDYEERYPNATELDGSGIWDTPYVIDENNQDNYPIIPEFPSANSASIHGLLYSRRCPCTEENWTISVT